MTWIAHDGAQDEFLQRTEFEVLFGGSAGGGKSDCIIAAMTRDIEHPRYHGLIIRRTFPQLREIIDRCHRLYPSLGGVYRATDKRWVFPSGAVIDLGHIQHEDEVAWGRSWSTIQGPSDFLFCEPAYLCPVSVNCESQAAHSLLQDPAIPHQDLLLPMLLVIFAR